MAQREIQDALSVERGVSVVARVAQPKIAGGDASALTGELAHAMVRKRHSDTNRVPIIQLEILHKTTPLSNRWAAGAVARTRGSYPYVRASASSQPRSCNTDAGC